MISWHEFESSQIVIEWMRRLGIGISYLDLNKFIQKIAKMKIYSMSYKQIKEYFNFKDLL